MLSRSKPATGLAGGDFDVVTGPPAPIRRAPAAEPASAAAPAALDLPALESTLAPTGRPDKPAA